jgi:integrase
MELEWRTDNPVTGVKGYRIESGGFHAWEEGEIQQFYNTHPLGSAAYLAMTLILYTGASRVDVVKLGRGSIKDGRIEYRRQKTRKNPDGIMVSIPVHPELARAIDLLPKDAFTFLQTEYKQARTANGLGTTMRKWCDDAGLPMCSSHGLRKAICRRLAEAGATAPEIMAVSGHTTLSEVQRYIESFGRKNMANSAIALLPDGPDAEQKVTNHPARFVKSSSKLMKGNNK